LGQGATSGGSLGSVTGAGAPSLANTPKPAAIADASATTATPTSTRRTGSVTARPKCRPQAADACPSGSTAVAAANTERGARSLTPRPDTAPAEALKMFR
jgi:hypothetical protein